jgi:hypothetical protein
MSLEIIPLPTDPNATPYRTQTTTLDGVPYRIDLRYNARGDLWMLSLYTIDDVPIATGRTLVANWDLLSGIGSELRPPGQLLYYSPDGLDPTLATLNDGKLYYLTVS